MFSIQLTPNELAKVMTALFATGQTDLGIALGRRVIPTTDTISAKDEAFIESVAKAKPPIDLDPMSIIAYIDRFGSHGEAARALADPSATSRAGQEMSRRYGVRGYSSAEIPNTEAWRHVKSVHQYSLAALQAYFPEGVRPWV
jgi:hypothetical protein